MLFGVEKVWCCFSPIERGVHTALVTFYITPPGWVEVDVFDAIWAFNDPDNYTPRKEAYIRDYGLVFEIVEPAPDVFIPVYRFTRTWWPALFFFFSTSDTSCPNPCDLVEFPPVA